MITIIAGITVDARAQLSGTFTIPGDYATISAAVTALNTSGVGTGGVTFNIAAGYTETLSATISLTATGTSANPIIFQKSGSGANPQITSYTGTAVANTSGTTLVLDGIWRFVGSDYVTIDGIDLVENAANTTNAQQMEYGYGMFKTSTNGCQNNTIKNCSISLSASNNATATSATGPVPNGSTGILITNAVFTNSNAALGINTAIGPNSNNDIYSNTISNCFNGIEIIGYNATAANIPYADAGNDIGGSSAATKNTISYSYNTAVAVTTVSAGIFVSGQQGVNIANNVLTSALYPGLVKGIYLGPAVSASATVNANTITVNGGNASTLVTGIENASGSTAASNTVAITNNNVVNGSYAFSLAAAGNFYGIYNTSTAATLSILNNTFTGNTVVNTGTSSGNNIPTLAGIFNNAACGTLTITGNIVADNTLTNSSTTATAGRIYSIYNGSGVTTTISITGNSLGSQSLSLSSFNLDGANTNTGTSVLVYNNGGGSAATLTITGNSFYNPIISTTVASTTALSCITSGTTVAASNISNNVFYNLNPNITGALTLITSSAAVTGGTLDINSNSISGTLSKTAVGSITCIALTGTSTGGTINHNNNNFSNITANGSSGILGINLTDNSAANTTRTIQNNVFNAWSSANTATGALTGISMSNSGASGSNTLIVQNNSFTNWTPSGTSATNGIAMTLSGTSNTVNASVSNNTINTITNAGTGTVTGISVTLSGATNATALTVQKNTITGLTNNANAAIVGITLPSGVATATGSILVSSNNLSSWTNSGTGTTTGITSSITATSTSAIVNFQNNILSTWTTGNGAITGIIANITPNGNAVTGNQLNAISGGTGTITGITTAAGNPNIWGNTINGLSGTGSVNGISATAGASGTIQEIYKNLVYGISTTSTTSQTANGILVSGGTINTVNVYKNKIYDIANTSSGTATALANGIIATGGAGAAAGTSPATPFICNIYDNVIGTITAPSASSAEAVRGININNSSTTQTNYNVYFNSIYITGTSSGTNFGSTGVYGINNTTASSAAVILDLRDNIIINLATPKGTGKTVALRRSGTTGAGTSTNYATTSNNNLFYAGTASVNNLLFYDGTNSYQTIATFRAGTNISPRETASVSEDETSFFISTTPSSVSFLRFTPTASPAAKNAGANVSGITDDIDGEIRQGNTGYIGSSTAPTIGADEIINDVTKPAITYTALTTQTVSTGISLTSVTITDANGVNTIPGYKPRLYYKRSVDNNTYVDNTSATNGWKYVEATGTTSPFTFNIDYTLLFGGGTNAGGNIQYFVTAQDIAAAPNVQINSGTFATTPASVALTSSAFPLGGTINSYNVWFNGTYNVGTTGGYTSLTNTGGLFDQINTYGMSGNVTVNITTDLSSEAGTVALNAWTESPASSNYTLTIQPDATTLRTISGSASTGLIRFNGADRVTINGGTSKSLLFKNTYTATATGSTAFTFANSAVSNTLSNLEADAYSTNGVIFFSTGNGTIGNNNNIIDNCNINGTISTSTSGTAIISTGTTTAGQENTGNTISNSNIYSYLNRGIDLTAGNSGWTITTNNLYNASVTAGAFAAGTQLYGIRVATGTGYTINGNSIGGTTSGAGGANAVYTSTGNLSFTGISLTATTTTASVIKGNAISAISISAVPTAASTLIFRGIETSGANITVGGTSTADGNIIGSKTVNGSIAVTTTTATATFTSIFNGISHAATGGTINYNQIGGIDINNVGAAPAPSTVQLIAATSTTAPTQINNNIIGSATLANSVRVLSTSTATTTSLAGIVLASTVASPVAVSNNRIDNISNLSTTSSGSFTGISSLTTNSAAVLTIQADTVQNITAAANANAGSTFYTGISAVSPSTISNNVVNAFTYPSTGTAAQIVGINNAGAYKFTVSNNTISSLTTSSAKADATIESGAPSLAAVAGIVNTATVTGQNITGNMIFGLSSTATSATAVGIIGIGVSGAPAGTHTIANNRVYGLTNSATSTSAGLVGILATTTSGTYNVYNNIIKLSNGAATNNVKIFGISAGGNSASGLVNLYYNSVQISGAPGTGSAKSASFIRPLTNVISLMDNILVNTRTGTGPNYAVSNPAATPASGWSSTASDYNDFYASTAANQGEWGSGVARTFATWKTSSGGDSHSVNAAVTFVASTADLVPDGSTNCAIYGTGTPIAAVTTDIAGATRNATTPDMGAYEFVYTSTTVTWTGNAGTSDWTNSRNWCGYVPTSGTDVIIASGAAIYPTLPTGTYIARNLQIQSGASLTITTGTLQIAGTITNSGTFTASNTAATVELNGSTAQTIPAATFATNTLGNLKTNNSAGVTLGGALSVLSVVYPTLGTFNANGNLTLVSSATQTALVDGTGAGSITGNVTMQRYLASGYGYKYFSSPVQAATVASFSSVVDLNASFPNFYNYTEANANTGFGTYTTTTNPLTPFVGYAVDFGSATAAKTVAITGVVNDGALSQTIYNTNQTYTQGFNLVGNPYPSPIEWSATSGWTKTNIDDALYYFDSASPSGANQYDGTYSTYIGGVSSDGIATNLIASMQGFFVHVSDGAYPVTGTLGVTNAVRVNNLTAYFHKSNSFKSNSITRSLVRVTAAYSGDAKSADPVVVYTDFGATPTFNKALDAVKLMNTNDNVPNFYVQRAGTLRLAINALSKMDTGTIVPLSLRLPKDGNVDFTLATAENLPGGVNPYLYDARIGRHIALKSGSKYSIKLAAGTYDNRFFITYNDKDENIAPDADNFYVYRKDGHVFANIRYVDNQPGDVSLVGITGNIISRQKINGNGIYDLGSPKVIGVYVISFMSGGKMHAKKIFVPESQ
ncbi:beta strand repeat-containing protein [Mucilaginibacter ginkgonis]|uniref:Uncharacterized protein n=1 Tax=Mucilaginibacter ginkgonis TaxID=2682091 RepID=A0A7T7JG25_9SPHI|nr:hypothetical protein [Mucilaginibacter ginkgonis]QQL49133.1 hypothetical protein GO620_013235 [Mucilaginibacter ginkgonis]